MRILSINKAITLLIIVGLTILVGGKGWEYSRRAALIKSFKAKVKAAQRDTMDPCKRNIAELIQSPFSGEQVAIIYGINFGTNHDLATKFMFDNPELLDGFQNGQLCKQSK